MLIVELQLPIWWGDPGGLKSMCNVCGVVASEQKKDKGTSASKQRLQKFQKKQGRGQDEQAPSDSVTVFP